MIRIAQANNQETEQMMYLYYNQERSKGWDGHASAGALDIYLDREIGRIPPWGDAVNYPLWRVIIVSMHKDRGEGLHVVYAKRSMGIIGQL